MHFGWDEFNIIVRNVAGLCEIVTKSAVRIEGKEMERQPRVVSYFLFIVAAMSDGGGRVFLRAYIFAVLCHGCMIHAMSKED